MIIRAFQPADLLAIDVQPRQSDQAGEMTIAQGERMAGDWAWTAEIDGRAVCCAGLWHVYGETAIAWAFMAEDAGPHLLAVTRKARKAIAAAPWRRLEATATPDWPAANRWLALLGFRNRGRVQHWGPAAVDMNWWEMVR